MFFNSFLIFYFKMFISTKAGIGALTVTLITVVVTLLLVLLNNKSYLVHI